MGDMSFPTAAGAARYKRDASGNIIGLASGTRNIFVPQIIYQNNIVTSSTDTSPSTANALDSFVVPGGLMGKNGALRFNIHMRRTAGSSDAMNTRLWANSTQIFAVGTTTNNGNIQYFFEWSNQNSETSQGGFYNQASPFNNVTATLGGTSIDTSQAFTIYLTCEMPSTGTAQKLGFHCELIRGNLT